MPLLLGDCLKRMDEIPDGSIDMVMADLPYGTTQNKWDSIIPLDKLWPQYLRVCKRNAAIVLTASQPFTSLLVMSNLGLFRYEWIWCKNRPTNFAHAKNKPMKKHESVLVFSRGTTVHASQSANRMPYNPQGVTEISPTTHTKRPSEKTDAFFADRPGHRAFTRNTTGYPHTLLTFSTDQLGLHPTAKPVALMEYLIKTYTNPGERVLDNCMGSGTTGVACANLGRKFTGIESDPEYFRAAKKRIMEARQK